MTEYKNLMFMRDFAVSDRAPLIRGDIRKVDLYSKKLAAAVAWMGSKWVLHPANQVKKLSEPMPEHGLRRFAPKVLKGRK
jgi:hypothetical protein